MSDNLDGFLSTCYSLEPLKFVRLIFYSVFGGEAKALNNGESGGYDIESLRGSGLPNLTGSSPPGSG